MSRPSHGGRGRIIGPEEEAQGPYAAVGGQSKVPLLQQRQQQQQRFLSGSAGSSSRSDSGSSYMAMDPMSPARSSSGGRRRLHAFDRHLKEAALERSAVGLVVVRVLDNGQPVAQRLVPDYRREDLKNPFVAEVLREGSCRLEECLPESYRTAPASLSPSRSGHCPEKEGIGASQDSSGALTDCTYFILYLGDTPPPSTNPFDDDPDLFPPAAEDDEGEDDDEKERGEASKSVSSSSTNMSSSALQQVSPRVMSLRRRKRRIYGITRRSPPSQQPPHCVVFLSAVPCFGLLRHQFMSLTSAFFARGCRDEPEGDLRAFLQAAANPTTGILHREVMARNPDVPVVWLVNLLGIEHVLGLVKLLLLEGRLLFHSAQAPKAAAAVLALASLLPGGYYQALGFEEGPSMAVAGYRWRKFGLPLRVFHQDNYLLLPLLVMAQAERVFARFQGFLVGTSDRLIPKLRAARLDAIIDLDACSIDSQRFLPLPHTYITQQSIIDVGPTAPAAMPTPASSQPKQQRSPPRRSSCSSSSCSSSSCSSPSPSSPAPPPPSPSALHLDLARVSFEYGPADADFLEEVLASLPAKQHTRSRPLSPAEETDVHWRGSDAWVRKHFQVYFEGFLGRAALALHTTIRDGALQERLAGPPASASGWVRRAVTGLLHATPRLPGGGFGFDVKLLDYNRAWVGQWTTTLNFRLWYESYPHACLEERLEREQQREGRSGSAAAAINDGAATLPASQLNGQTSYTHPNGDTHQGEMVVHAATDDGGAVCQERATGKNRFHGKKGKYVDADGSVYEGEVRQGRREGAGTLTKTDGEVYRGEWRMGEREGLGTCHYPDGSHYTGEWRRGLWHGEGTLVSASGDKHEGLWSGGQRCGWGVWTSPTGDVVEGEWADDEPADGEWTISYSNGDQFVGRCRDGQPEGFGVCKYANGAVYSGEWAGGQRAGWGKCVFANGEIYDGLWERDHVSLRGQGTLSFQDGRVHEFT